MQVRTPPHDEPGARILRNLLLVAVCVAAALLLGLVVIPAAESSLLAWTWRERPARDATDTLSATWSFTVEDEQVTIEVPVLREDYERARRTDALDSFHYQKDTAGIRRIVAVFRDTRPVESFCSSMRGVRDAYGLDSDEYAQAIASAVQALPYSSSRDTLDGIALPAETLVEMTGDCSDKSFLLALALWHEGYDVALIGLDQDEHAAAGIRVYGPSYFDSGYAFIESTTPADIGWAEAGADVTPNIVRLPGETVFGGRAP